MKYYVVINIVHYGVHLAIIYQFILSTSHMDGEPEECKK